MLTLGQAAKHAGVSKATLSRAIKSGRLSAVPNDRNGWDIDPAELFRAFPRNPGNGSDNGSMKQSATPPATDETLALRAEIEGLRQQLVLMRESLDREREIAGGWQRQAESAQRLLTDQSAGRRGWFGRLVG
jgi:hypothetical protein